MVSAARLRADIERLKARAAARRARISADRVRFAADAGLGELDPWQGRLLRSEEGRVLLNCSRQSGKSTMAAVLALHRSLHAPGSLVLILAPAERQAKELFSKVAESYRVLGHPVPADSYRKLGMGLANGSRIEALPGTEKTIRGFSGVDLLLVDEASRVADELYYAVRPMLAVSGGRLMMLSTPYGKRGVFFEEWEGGEGWERYEVPASECPRIPEVFLEEERRALPAWVYRQEYECSFEETDDQVFSHELVRAAISEEVTPLFGEVELTEDAVRLIGVDLGQQRDHTAISVTERALVPTGGVEREAYWDGIFHQTRFRSVAVGAPEYRVRHLERPPLGTPYTDVVERVVELVKTLGGRPVVAVDATGVGRPVTDMLWKRLREALEGTNIGVDHCTITITGGDSVTKSPDGGLRVPKRDLVSSTLVLMQNGRLKIADALPLKDVLVKELLNFRVKINISTAHDSYEAWREGDHDDLVLSVAMACWAGERFLRRRMRVRPKPVGF